MIKNIKIILILFLFTNFSYSQKATFDSIQFVKKVYKNLDICKTLSFNGGFKTDENNLDINVLSASNSETGHDITLKMNFSSFDKELPIENNIENYETTELIIDGQEVDFKSINLFLSNKSIKINNLPFDLLNLGNDNDNGRIKYFKDNDGEEYIIIKCGILGCSGFSCNGFYLLIIKIHGKNTKDLVAVKYSDTMPFDFDNIMLFKTDKNKSPMILTYDSEQVNDQIKSTLKVFDLKGFKLDKDKKGKLFNIDYIYTLWKKSNIKVYSSNWYSNLLK